MIVKDADLEDEGRAQTLRQLWVFVDGCRQCILVNHGVIEAVGNLRHIDVGVLWQQQTWLNRHINLMSKRHRQHGRLHGNRLRGHICDYIILGNVSSEQ